MAEVLTKLKANVNGEVVDAQICYQNCVTNKPTFKTINGETIIGEGNIITAAGSSGVPIDSIYPVGSIYMSVVNKSPAEFIGGTWERLKDRFLLAAGDTYSNGATGGSATHTLTVNEMPSHTHLQNAHNHTQELHQHDVKIHVRTAKEGIGNDYGQEGNRIMTNTGGTINIGFGGLAWADGTAGVNYATTATNQNTGGGQAHNNMPPYLAVYMWKRTA